MKTPLIIAASLLVAVSCSGGDGGVSVRMDEFSLDVSPDRVEAGHVQFAVRNMGDVPHTLLVLRTDLEAGELPVEDSAVDTGAPGIEVAVQTRDPLEASAGVVLAMAADLEAGAHVLICNVPGHYLSGMHAPFEVTRPSR